MIPSPRLAACVSIVEVALARPLRVRDELTGAVYVRRGAQGELPRHHRRDGEKQADVSGSVGQGQEKQVIPILACLQAEGIDTVEDLVSLPRKCRELLIEKLVRTTQLPIGEVAKLERIDRAELPCRRASAATSKVVRT